MIRSTKLVALAGLLSGVGLALLLPASRIFVTTTLDHEASGGSTGERWACPMMDFIGDRPGPCPVCGMALQRVTAGDLTLEQQRRMGLETVKVTAGPALATVRAYGAVRYDDRTARVVIPRVAGRIVRRHRSALHAGTEVAMGDPVVDLYSAEVFAAQGELAAAVKLSDDAAVRALTERFERWNLGDVARAVVAGHPPVDTVTVRSPFAGRSVSTLGDEGGEMQRRPQVGKEVMADTPLLTLVSTDHFMVVVHVPETRAHWVHVGQPVRLSSDDFGDLPDVAAEVDWVAPELNLEIRAREVHLHLHDSRSRLLVGSLVSARFEVDLNAGSAVLVPKAAVLSTGVRSVAWKVADRASDGRIRFELATLALGPRLEDAAGSDWYVVRAGLQAGDEVAAQGAFLVDSQAQLAGSPSLLFPAGAAGATSQSTGR